MGLSYLTYDHNFTQLLTQTSGAGNVTAVEALDSRETQRLLVMPVDFRYGINDRLQAFASVPFGWSNTEISALGLEDYTNEGGIGDVSAGVSWLVHKSCGWQLRPQHHCHLRRHRADGERQPVAGHPGGRPTPCWARDSGMAIGT